MLLAAHRSLGLLADVPHSPLSGPRELCHFLHLAASLPSPPSLEKVKAHDDAAISIGHPKALGNDAADRCARKASSSPSVPLWDPVDRPFRDAVEFRDAAGLPILNVEVALTRDWWIQASQSCTARRPRLAALYPSSIDIDWSASCVIFRRPTVSATSF